MRYFPVFLDLERRRVLVVGGGEEALQKVRLLAKTPALITLVAAELVDELVAMERAGIIVVRRRSFEAEDVPGVALIYVASDEEALKVKVRRSAEEHNVPVNVIDQPQACDFFTPAIVDRAPITIAIGSEGAAPVLAREIRAHLEDWLPAKLGAVAEKARALRATVRASITHGPTRRRFWERLLASDFRRHVLNGNNAEADRAFDRLLKGKAKEVEGAISLVGAGPGDPELLTLKAKQALQAADVIVYDRLVDPEVLEYARRDARRIFVGKVPGCPDHSQPEINRILVAEAQDGQRVVRLKGGDPFVFGRAGEELEAAKRSGIDVDVVPGITSAHACAARVGLPITLRGKHRQFAVLTGATGDGTLEHDWCALSEPGVAFAIYMGVRNAPKFRAQLLGSGAKPSTSLVIVENGTRENERAYHTTLDDFDACIRDEQLKGPAIIFVGLDWRSAGLTRPSNVKLYRCKRAQSQKSCATSEFEQSFYCVMG